MKTVMCVLIFAIFSLLAGAHQIDASIHNLRIVLGMLIGTLVLVFIAYKTKAD